MKVVWLVSGACILVSLGEGCESFSSSDATADAKSDAVVVGDAAMDGVGGSMTGTEAGSEGSNGTDASSGPDAASDGASLADADATTDDRDPMDARPATCSPTSKFGAPMLIPGAINSSDDELSPRLSVDERTIYFGLRAAGNPTAPTHLYMANRATPTSSFEAAVALPVNSAGSDADPMITTDGLTLFFASDRANGSGEIDLYWSSRANTIGPFISVTPVPAVNSTGSEVHPFLSSDGELWFAWRRPGSDSALHLRRAPRAGAGFAAPIPVNELDSATDDAWPVLTSDKRTIYFSSPRTGLGAKGKNDVWQANRSSSTATFDPPSNVVEINSAQSDYAGWVSPDNCRLYLSSNRDAGSYDLYVATR